MVHRAVVVGAGAISGVWFPALKEQDVEIAGVVDLREDAAGARVEEFELDAAVSPDLEATLRKVQPDFVVDLTVPEAHCEVTCTALEAGCHVIGEKPMASGMDEARRMVETSERTGSLYMVSQSRRYNERHDRIRLTLEAGGLGRPTIVNCAFYLDPHFGGFRDEMESPLILDMAIHHFDLLRFLTGLDPLSVYCHEYNPAHSWYAGDAAASCLFQMSDGVMFNYLGCWCGQGCRTSWNGDWRIVGENGTLIYERDEAPWGELVIMGDGGRETRDLQIAESPLEYAGQRGALHELLTYLETGEMPQCECHDNIKSLAMVFAAMESSRRGERLPVG